MNEQVVDEEPDYRFTLANERTFLAWIRTALAFLAASVVVNEIFTASGSRGPDIVALAIVCTVAATVIAVGAFRRWRQVQEAMRRSAPLPTPTSVMRLIVLLMCVSAVVCSAVVLV